jgi:flagellar hook-associated protein 3 FlgL
MRVASTQYHATMNTALQNAQVRLEKVMQQMASGQRVQMPSDDPIATVRLGRLAREDAALTQYRDNIAALNERLRQGEARLDSMNSDLMAARDLLVWAADGSNTSEDVNAMVTQLQALRDSVLATANSRDSEGRYVFSGTAVNTATVTFDGAAAVGSRYTFTGNTGEQRVVVGHGVTQVANTTLDDVATFLNQLDRSIDTLSASGVSVNDPAVHAELATTLNQTDTFLASVNTHIARIGGAMTTLAILDTTHANVSLSNQQATLTLGQLDYAEAAVRFNGYTSALQATQKAYAKVSALSLFNVI